eukprot:m.487333 g.487333  ORF g.487333 m.487333 type:complete len:658 (-) comp24948_c0_seq1:171-2144(-)
MASFSMSPSPSGGGGSAVSLKPKSEWSQTDLDAAGITITDLVQLLGTVHRETQASTQFSPEVLRFITKFEDPLQLLLADTVCVQRFVEKKLLARGSIADIVLVSHCHLPNRPFVLKRMDKAEVVAQGNAVCAREEFECMKQISLLQASKVCPELGAQHARQMHRLPFGGLESIAPLWFAFSDHSHLYFVSDFYAGCDVLGLLSKHDKFSEDTARFYLAEALVAIETVHALGWVHRDIKPENLFVTSRGHIVLGDFGSCARIEDDGFVAKERSALPGGTPEYVSPELLRAIQGDSRVRYGQSCDWWSLGVVLFEMLYGETPFVGDSAVEVYKMISDHERILRSRFADKSVSLLAKDLIGKLCCSQELRLNVEEIRGHAWFGDLQWDSLRKQKSPLLPPELSSPFDTAFFEDAEENTPIRKPFSTLSLADQLGFSDFYFANPGVDSLCVVQEGRSRRRNSDGKSTRKMARAAANKLSAAAAAAGSSSLGVPPREQGQPKPLRSSLHLPDSTPAPVTHKRVHFDVKVLFFDAARRGDAQNLKTLLESAGAPDVDATTGTDMTALCLACANSQFKAAEFLIQAGADVNTQANDGCTPLHLSVLEEATDIVDLLLASGADCSAQNIDGETPVDWAEDTDALGPVLHKALARQRLSGGPSVMV